MGKCFKPCLTLQSITISSNQTWPTSGRLSQPTGSCRQVWRRQMLYLSQFLSTDVEKKGAQIALHRLLPLSMSKKSRQKTKTSPQKNRFFADFCLGEEVWEGGWHRIFVRNWKKTCPMDSSCHGSLTEVGSKSILGPIFMFNFCSICARTGTFQACLPTHKRREVGPTKKKFTGP